MRKICFFLSLLFGCAVIITACKDTNKVTEAETAVVPESTIVTVADLKMRIAPNTTAVEIARLSRGERVHIVQRSAESVQIGKKQAHWFKITNAAGLTGWAYGAGLAVESDEGNVQDIQAKAEKKLRDAMIGRWEAATIQGALTPNFVALYTDGKIEFGINRSKTQTGKYEIIFDGANAQVIVSDIKNPMMTDIKAKMVGETLVFEAVKDGKDYKLNLADKDPGGLEAEKKAKTDAATTAP